MPKIIITKPFRFAHNGYEFHEYEPTSTAVDVPDECAVVAVQEGWARAAPENADAARKRETRKS